MHPGRTTRLTHCECGVSLYEMLIALAVAAVLGATAVPGMRDLLARQRMTTAVNQFVLALSYARSEAIKRAQAVALCPTEKDSGCAPAGDHGTFWQSGILVFVDMNRNYEWDPTEPVLRIFPDVGRGLVIASSRHRSRVVYRANGRAGGTNITYHFCHPDGRAAARALIVSNSGRPRTASTTPDGRTPGCPTPSER